MVVTSARNCLYALVLQCRVYHDCSDLRYPGHQNADADKMATQSEITVDGNNFGEHTLYRSITLMPMKIGGLAGVSF